GPRRRRVRQQFEQLLERRWKRERHFERERVLERKRLHEQFLGVHRVFLERAGRERIGHVRVRHALPPQGKHVLPAPRRRRRRRILHGWEHGDLPGERRNVPLRRRDRLSDERQRGRATVRGPEPSSVRLRKEAVTRDEAARAGGSRARDAALLVLLATAALLPSLFAPFFADDYLHVEVAARWRDALTRGWILPIDLAGTWWTPRGLSVEYFRPLVVVSFAVDHVLYGAHAVGYH